jgi:hypothetical protein
VLSADGIGMPPSRHLVQDVALQPGALFTGRKVQPRTLVLLADLIGSSRPNLHSLRKVLIDAIKPDIVAKEQPVIFRYSGASTTVPALDVYAYYDTGLGGLLPTGFTEEVSMRFIAYDPYWYDDGSAAAALTGTQTLANPNYIVAKIAGTWQKLSTGMNGYIYVLAQGPDGSIYAGGAFTTAGGTTVNNIAKWNGSAWSALGGTPGVDDEVRAIVFDAAGNMGGCRRRRG